MKKFWEIPWKRVGVYAMFLIVLSLLYVAWSPGKLHKDGRHDLRHNAIWLQHGWIGDDLWFETHKKHHKKATLRSKKSVQQLAGRLRSHGIHDLYPHLAPSYPNGALLSPDHDQLRMFLEVFEHERIMPWIGGVKDRHVHAKDPGWKNRFIADTQALLTRHPRLAGVHLNIEPQPSGDVDLLTFVRELRAALPPGKVLSLAASPPPIPLIGNEIVHWTPEYIAKLSRHADQMVFMNYDSSLKVQKLYVRLQERWVRQILDNTQDTQVLIGLPAYDDDWAPWHDPRVENLKTALAGLHAGLETYPKLPEHYKGVAIYSDWEMSEDEWKTFATYFRKK